LVEGRWQCPLFYALRTQLGPRLRSEKGQQRKSAVYSPTCESCTSIDARKWNRQGLLRAGQAFSRSWNRSGVPCGSMFVCTEADAVVLMSRWRSPGDSEWKLVEQRVPIVWTICHLGGRRPWFRCTAFSNGRYCGRRVAILYGAGEVFACRRCYGLAYASQQESPRFRKISRSRKIRMRLGGGPNILEPFPEKPRRMHRQTYLRLRARGEAADAIAFGRRQRFVSMT
jgi:hypothetical protein